MDRVGIDGFHLVGEGQLARQYERLGGEGGIAAGVNQRLADRSDEIGIEQRHRTAALLVCGNAVEQYADRGLLTGVPARHRIGIVDREKF